MKVKILLFVCSVAAFLPGLHCTPNESLILKRIFENYDAASRPAALDNQTVYVHMAVFFRKLIDLNEKERALTLQFTIFQRWEDHRLAWNRSHYNDVSRIAVASSKVWLPDIILDNSIDENFDRRYPVPAVIEHTGRVTWDPTGSFKSRCDVDVTWFPYDTQQCELHFYTWSYMETGVNLTIIPEGEFLEEYDDDGAWIIEKNETLYYRQTFQGFPYPYATVAYRLYLQRSSILYTFTLVLPTGILSVLCAMTFYLPADSSARIGLSSAVLIALCIFSNMMSSKLPNTKSTVSLIEVYLTCLLTTCALSVVLAVIVFNLRSRGLNNIYPMSKRLRNVCRSLASRLRIPIDRTSMATDDWLIAAHVTDRLCCILFTTVMLLVLVAFVTVATALSAIKAE